MRISDLTSDLCSSVRAGKILIATGAWPIVPHFPGAGHGITSNEVFHLDTFPKREVIAGAGYITNEFAVIFHKFGAHVTMVNRTDVILRGYDEQISTEEHPPELQHLMHISNAVLCLTQTRLNCANNKP